MKRFAVAVVAALAILALAILPAASAQKPHAASWSAGDQPVRTSAIGVGRKHRLPVGTRLRAHFSAPVKSYQWLRCNLTGAACKAIPGATHAYYVVTSADLGHSLRVRATLQGNTVAVSAPTQQVGLPLPVNTALPTIVDNGPGTLSAPLVGDSLTGTQGTWTGAVAFAYQWMDCNATGASCTPIAGATSAAYTIAASDAGHTIVFQVTAYNYQPAG